jgi:CHRD domain
MRRRIIALAAVLALLLLLAAPGVAAAGDRATLLTAELSGANELAGGDPDGSGQATVLLRGDRVCFAVSFSNIGAPVAGHIHSGAAGVNGPIVVPFFTTALPATVSSAAGCVTATADLVAAIAAHPDQYYANLHTAEFPAGAIRGQLHPARDLDIDLPRPLRAVLTGANEIAGGDPDGAALAFVSARDGDVCFLLAWTRIAAPFAGHIHSGAAGVNGPIVVPFFTTPVPDTVFAVDGCIHGVDAALVKDIRKNPDQYYVNLHTPDFPAGAVRGQLHR